MAFQGDSIYWVEVEKIVPNPFQPRREFDEQKLKELSESIRMYGVLQPLTVTRNEIQRDDGTFYTEYELVAGERRLRASKLAGLTQVPVIIREGENNEQEKLELAIIENLQREDLNAVDRALAFRQLAEVFGLSHAQVAQKVGRSREYVSNSIRLLGLPDYMLSSLRLGEMTEGHARTLLMLNDRPEEQDVVFREILLKKLSVREVEKIVRKIATDKVRKKNDVDFDTELIEIEKRFMETLGTRVHIQKTDFGGKLTIDYFSVEDLEQMLVLMKADQKVGDNKKDFDTLATHTPLTIIKEDEEVSSKFDESLSHPSQIDNDKDKMIYGDFSMDDDMDTTPVLTKNQIQPKPDHSEISAINTNLTEEVLPKIENHQVDLIAPVHREEIANRIPNGFLENRVQQSEVNNNVSNHPSLNQQFQTQNPINNHVFKQEQHEQHFVNNFELNQNYQNHQGEEFKVKDDVVLKPQNGGFENNEIETRNDYDRTENYNHNSHLPQNQFQSQAQFQPQPQPQPKQTLEYNRVENKSMNVPQQNQSSVSQGEINSASIQPQKQIPPQVPKLLPSDDDSDLYSIRNFSM